VGLILGSQEAAASVRGSPGTSEISLAAARRLTV